MCVRMILAETTALLLKVHDKNTIRTHGHKDKDKDKHTHTHTHTLHVHMSVPY